MKKSGSSLIIVCTAFAFISLMIIGALRSSGFLFDLAVQRIEKAKKEATLEGILAYAVARSVQESAVNNFIWVDSNGATIQVVMAFALREEIKSVDLHAEKDGLLYGQARAEFILGNGKHIIRTWNISPA
jgi:hypothetical protein